MNILEFQTNKMKKFSLLAILKISIIVFVSISLLGNFVPYYEGADDKVYGITAIQLSQGFYGFTNELIQQSNSEVFIPKQWVKTSIEGDIVIPISLPGIITLGSISYSLAGYYGLFYLGPIMTILLLVVSERVSTKLFGNFVGFVTLLLVAADWKIFQVGIRLFTDNIFAIFFVLGFFFLIKYFYEQKQKYLLLCSVFLATSTFFRINGIIFLPIEILLLIGIYWFHSKERKIKSSEKNTLDKNIFNKITLLKNFTTIKFHKNLLFILTPWIIFILFWLSFNSFYFSDATTNYDTELREVQPEMSIISPEYTDEEIKEIVQDIREDKTKNRLRSFLVFDSERLEWIKFYGVSLMPDFITFSATYLNPPDPDDWKSENWMSVFSFFIIFLALGISFIFRFKRAEIFSGSLFILASLLFFSSSTIAPSTLFPPSGAIQDRYMIFISIISFMLFGFILERFKHFCFQKYTFSNKSFYITLKILFIIIVSIFLLSTFFIMPSIQDILQSNFKINNPEEFVKRFPLDKEGLSDKSVILGDLGRDTVEYDFIHFNPFVKYSTKGGWNPDRIKQEPIDLLREITDEGYDTFAFRKNMRPIDEQYFKYIETNHNITLKKYSDKFCKFEITPNVGEENKKSTSDIDCFSDVNREPLYGWDVRVKPPWYFFK